MGKALLVLGASLEHIEIIRAARALGYRVVTVGPDSPAHLRSDGAYIAGIDDLATVTAIARREQVNGVLGAFSDGALQAANHIASELGLPSVAPASLAVLCSKTKFRESITDLGLPHPQTHLFRKDTQLPPGMFQNARWVLKGDQGDGDLNADSIFRAADEVGDLQGLFHQAEEQLDLPTQLVKIGDLSRRCVEIVAEDAQHHAGLGHHDNLSHRHLHRVLAAIGLAGRQKADPVAQDAECHAAQGSAHQERRSGQ